MCHMLQQFLITPQQRKAKITNSNIFCFWKVLNTSLWLNSGREDLKTWWNSSIRHCINLQTTLPLTELSFLRCNSSSSLQILRNVPDFSENTSEQQQWLTLLDAAGQKPLTPLPGLQPPWPVQAGWPCTAGPVSDPWWTINTDSAEGRQKELQSNQLACTKHL